MEDIQPNYLAIFPPFRAKWLARWLQSCQPTTNKPLGKKEQGDGGTKSGSGAGNRQSAVGG
jgi:hypothetical protein